MKHVLIRNPRLVGWEYGMLRAFEEEIIRQTNAEVVDTPHYHLPVISDRTGHGMRWDPLRDYIPKKPLPIHADVIWYVLMGPENYELDLFKDWGLSAKHRIVYLYDTLQPQFSLMKKLFSGDDFNIRITSFNDAVPYLQELTGQPWHAVEQAVPAGLFKPVTPSEKVIDFSSYGRRFPEFHQALLEFCSSNGLYYDYTMHAVKNPTAPEPELYRQYAWHLTHSKFTVSWPVELTNPIRAGKMSPITCRWFEAAASATIVLGRKPANDKFDDQVDDGLVVEIDPFDEKSKILRRLDAIYADLDNLQKRANEIEAENRGRFTWEEKVKRILELIPDSN